MPRRIFRSRAYQLAQEPESLVMIARSGRRGDNSQATRCGLIGWAGCMARSSAVSHQSATCFSMCSRQLRSVFCSSSGSSSAQGLGRIAVQVDLGRIADAEHRGVDVDLHAARMALLGQELRIGEAGADHQEGVAAHHQLVAGLGAQIADRARHPRQVVGRAPLPSSALAAPAPSLSATAITSSVACKAPAPTRMATFLPAFSTSAARRRSAS